MWNCKFPHVSTVMWPSPRGLAGDVPGNRRGPFAAPPERVVVVYDQKLVARDPGAPSGQTLPLGGCCLTPEEGT
jgi:hypothetical protein